MGARSTGNNFFDLLLKSQLKLSPVSIFFLIFHLPKTIIQTCIRGTLESLLFYLAYWPRIYKEIPNKISSQINKLKFKIWLVPQNIFQSTSAYCPDCSNEYQLKLKIWLVIYKTQLCWPRISGTSECLSISLRILP